MKGFFFDFFMCEWPDQRKNSIHFGKDLDHILHWLCSKNAILFDHSLTLNHISPTLEIRQLCYWLCLIWGKVEKACD